MGKSIQILPIASRQIVMEENSAKQIVFVPDALRAEIVIEQKANSTLDIFVLNTDGKAHISLTITQSGEGAETNLYGVTIGAEEHESGLHSLINHTVPHGKSKQLYKCILSDKAQSSFVGELKVLPQAQKVEAYQTNRNILLSETAKMYTKPQLEIYADDVRCSHGATTGQLDESALFYMQQRGIAANTARMMLMNAFVADILQALEDEEVRTKFVDEIEKTLQKITNN